MLCIKQTFTTSFMVGVGLIMMGIACSLVGEIVHPNMDGVRTMIYSTCKSYL